MESPRQKKIADDAAKAQKARQKALQDANEASANAGKLAPPDNDSFFQYAGAKPIPTYNTIGDMLTADQANKVDWSRPFIITGVHELKAVADSSSGKSATSLMKSQAAVASTD